MGDYMIS